MQTINARFFGRHIDIDATSIMLADDSATTVHFIWPEETSLYSKVIHCELPSGYKFARVLNGDDFIITHDMTTRSGKMIINVSFMDGDAEKWSTFDKVLDIFQRVDATGEELERTEPTVIDSIIAHDAQQDERLTSLENGNTGELTQVYVDSGDAKTLEAAKAYSDNIALTPGPQGPAGPQGPQGPAGSDGATGPQGERGLQGPQGEIGPMGPQGPKGDTGAAGAVGPQGPKGDTGAQGPIGPIGPAGADGAQGLQGAQGEVGPQGPQGVPGVDGAQGPAGKDGVDGLTTIAAATDFFRGSQTAYDALTVEQKSAIMLAVVV